MEIYDIEIAGETIHVTIHESAVRHYGENYDVAVPGVDVITDTQVRVSPEFLNFSEDTQHVLILFSIKDKQNDIEPWSIAYAETAKLLGVEKVDRAIMDICECTIAAFEAKYPGFREEKGHTLLEAAESEIHEYRILL